MVGRLHRLSEHDRSSFSLVINGSPVCALEGDTLLTAILVNLEYLNFAHFGGETRAGFCIMGSCQDCWVTTKDGRRLQACVTAAAPGLEVVVVSRSENEQL